MANMQFTPMVDMDLICIQRARIPPESPILLLFGSCRGHLGVLMCFPMFPDLFRVIRVVKFETCQKKSFLGLIPLVNRPYEGGPKWKGKMTLFSTFLAIFQHNQVKEMGKALVPVGPTLFVHLGHPIHPAC